MYPLLLKPAVKDYIWGGTKLKTDYGYETDKAIAAEAWVLSCHKDGPNTVVNGVCAGRSLPEVLAEWGDAALGARAAAFPDFPILIKLIDAKQKLSIQVHPADDYAMRVEGEYGKTEMWYVVDCEPGAQLVYGFERELSREEFERRIRDNTLTEVCRFVPVNKGDVFFIAAGTLHAIGEGILIAEVQQNSNTTYRVSDYGRLGADGKPRPLHVEKALDVTECKPPVLPYGAVGEVTLRDGNRVRALATCDKFTADLWELTAPTTVGEADTFVSVLVLEGSLTLRQEDVTLTAAKGDSLFIPAGMTARLEGAATLLVSKV